MSIDLWLVRHASTDWSVAGRLNGRTDVGLNARGAEEAERLRVELLGQRFDSIVSSDSSRAVETARSIAGEPRPDPRLRELDFGSLEGLTWEACSEETRAALIRFDGFAAPGGETVAAMRERVLSALAELRPGTHLIVTHGGVIRLLCRMQDGADRRTEPGSLVRLVFAGSGRGTFAGS